LAQSRKKYLANYRYYCYEIGFFSSAKASVYFVAVLKLNKKVIAYYDYNFFTVFVPLMGTGEYQR
jgi:hypothetical protein